ncbi:helix-turn-helix domain-containing protein [Paenibacillus sepulcri]|uniref:Helix-turn-helix domain-containing protein n=1 Tax=Paenibacillus sepulcri TaxID=359917 RepID=A0ABS7BYX8_9BACL|nr:helix-turn-helix domain-containing protein [Paenibacillus sepulcri]
MSVGQRLRSLRLEKKLNQTEFASHLSMDRTQLSRIESGERDPGTPIRQLLSRSSWKMALEVAAEQTDGFFGNILHDIPNLDLHPAALKDVLLKELGEAGTALGELAMAKHIDPSKRRDSAERVWQEIRDVIEKAAVMQGVLEEEFRLDRRRLIQKHEMEVKRGER